MENNSDLITLKVRYPQINGAKTMDFGEKLQQLRKEKDWTQEELAEKLYVSRTAISKWESGRGFPSIDSLKEISKFFSVTIDDLLSGEQLLDLAETDSKAKTGNMRNMIFGIADCMVALLYALPIFAYYDNGVLHNVTLLYHGWYDRSNLIQGAYLLLTDVSVLFGITQFALQNVTNRIWRNFRVVFSLSLSAVGTMLFIMGRQPYAAAIMLCLLIIKGCILLKRQ